MSHVKPVLYFLTIVLGLVQIGLAFALTTSVDREINSRQVRPLNVQGPQESMHTGDITPDTARRLTIVAAGIGTTGGCCMMIGTVLIAAHMLQVHSAKSRLGTDVKPDP
jgi:hypothetical protein